MPLYLIERNYAEQLDLTHIDEGVAQIRLINEDLSVNWIYSFLSADMKKSWCLYEAPNVESIREAARRANIPADVIVELNGQVQPDGNIIPASAFFR